MNVCCKYNSYMYFYENIVCLDPNLDDEELTLAAIEKKYMYYDFWKIRLLLWSACVKAIGKVEITNLVTTRHPTSGCNRTPCGII